MNNRKEFNDYIVKQTNKYQKKYGFMIGTGKHASWNNEADAFKHTYLSAWLVIQYNDTFSNIIGTYHENETPNAPQYETNMDLWNNMVGREIGREIKSIINGKNYSQIEIEDMIAQKIMQKMNNGELIVNPFVDNRKFIPQDFIDKIFCIKNRIFHKNEISMKDLNDPMIKDLFLDQAFEINGLPTKEELDKRVKAGELVYVNEYNRTDGTKVNGYYRAYPRC